MVVFSFLNFRLLILITCFLVSCRTKEWIVPPEYIGSWKTNKTEITVRYKTGNEDSQFFSDTADVIIRINNDKTAYGRIGNAVISNGIMVKTWSLPPLKEVEYFIKCDLEGKIFMSDPLSLKQVELWLGSHHNHDTLKASLLKGGSVFPMGLMFLERVYE